MSEQRRGSLAVGIILLLLGGWFLAQQLVPGFESWVESHLDWPFIIIGIGLAFLIIGAATGVPGLAVPACIIGGIGGLLYYQNVTGDWASWSYAWTLIPGFVGVGIFLMHTMEGKFRLALREGGNTILVSLVLFAIFGSFLGGPAILGQYWPVLVILLGLWMLVRALLGKS